jgi:hypothetical protein
MPLKVYNNDNKTNHRLNTAQAQHEKCIIKVQPWKLNIEHEGSHVLLFAALLVV